MTQGHIGGIIGQMNLLMNDMTTEIKERWEEF